MDYTIIDSPVGALLLAADEAGLRTILFPRGGCAAEPAPDWRPDPTPLASAVRQLESYFAGDRREFDLPLAPRGTDFQRRVWQELGEIPFGATLSYGELARRIGRPTAVRAVGAANGANPLPIVIPCHRVIGSTGQLVGYGGGVEVKRALLDLERGGCLPF
jgi:methylated-DNA-[protein]-cysteine S-methyltransferase